MSKSRSRSRGRTTRISHESDEDLFDNEEDSFAKERDTVRMARGRSGFVHESKGLSKENRRLESTLELDSIRARREAPAVVDRRKSAKKKQRKQAKEDQIFESESEDEETGIQFQDEGFVSEEDDASEEENEDEEDADTSVWGNQRKSYYGTDVLHRNRNEDPDDPLSKTRAALFEEDEAKRLRKQATFGMRLEDFGDAVPEGSKDGSDEEEEESKGAKTRAERKKKQKGEERVVKDISGLGDEQKLKILQNDAPELLQLIDEFQNNAATLNTVIAPLLEKVKNSNDPDVQTSQGLTYLEAKYHLMLSYCTNLSFYFLLKASGKSPKDHPVIDQLVRLRLLIEKIRPLDQKLKYQVDKLLRLATLGPAASSDQKDPLSFRPRIDNLDDDDDDDDNDDGDDDSDQKKSSGRGREEEEEKLYKAPRITGRTFGGDLDKKKKQAERQHAKIAQSSMMQFLQEEYGDAPRAMDAGSSKSGRQDDSDDDEEERTRFEEEYLVRLPLTKKQKQKQQQKQQKQNITLSSELNQLDDFGDIAGLVSKPVSKSLGHYLNEIDQDTISSSHAREHSGDADLPISSRGGSQNDKRSRSKGRTGGQKKGNKFARRR